MYLREKSGNEKNTVKRIGAKMNKPIPGLNMLPIAASKNEDVLADSAIKVVDVFNMLEKGEIPKRMKS